MHIAFWGIRRSPFSSHIDPSDYYPSAVHEEAWARFEFLVSNSRRLGFLLGSSGMGKSLLLEVAAQHLRQSGAHVVKVNVVGIAPSEFVWKVAAGLGYLAAPDASVVECWQAITDRLVANRYQRISTVVMLDDVDEAQRDIQATISRLSLIDPHPDARFHNAVDRSAAAHGGTREANLTIFVNCGLILSRGKQTRPHAI